MTDDAGNDNFFNLFGDEFCVIRNNFITLRAQTACRASVEGNAGEKRGGSGLLTLWKSVYQDATS